jgi:hypothetical protein
MKKALIGIFLVVLAIAGQAQGLNKIIVEKYYVSDATDLTKSGRTLPVGSITWRIFVDMAPGYVFQQASGDKYHSLVMTTTTSFYNSALGDYSPNIITTANAKTETVMLDSWLSTGAAAKSYWGILKSQDNGVGTLENTDGALMNNDPSAGIPLTTQDGLLLGGTGGVPAVPSISTLGIPDAMLAILGDGTTSGGSFTLTNGAWYILGGVAGTDTTNRVLIAQVTTDGEFHYELNVQLGKDLGGGLSLTEKYVAMNPQQDEKSGPQYNLSGTLAPDYGVIACNITAPGSGSNHTVGDTVTIAANATCASSSIVKVEFFVDDLLVGVDSTAPYSSSFVGTLGSHTITATATNSIDVHVTSEPVIFNLIASNIDNFNAGPSFSVYPNPASDRVTLAVTVSKQISQCSYKVINMNGQVVINKAIGSISDKHIEDINISSLAKGQYTIQVSYDDNIIIQKIMKQ